MTLKPNLKYGLVLIGALCMLSCLQLANELNNWSEYENIDQISGKYHVLDEDGVKLFLPDEFDRLSYIGYKKMLDSLISKKAFNYESARLRSLREMEGRLYIFFDDITGSTVTVNTMPYTPLSRDDAQYLLGMIKIGNDKISDELGINIEKITARYKDGVNAQIFKAIYKIDDHKKLGTVYNSTYIITSNSGKTLFIQLITPFEVDFDPFLQKMII